MRLPAQYNELILFWKAKIRFTQQQTCQTGEKINLKIHYTTNNIVETQCLRDGKIQNWKVEKPFLCATDGFLKLTLIQRILCH